MSSDENHSRKKFWTLFKFKTLYAFQDHFYVHTIESGGYGYVEKERLEKYDWNDVCLKTCFNYEPPYSDEDNEMCLSEYLKTGKADDLLEYLRKPYKIVRNRNYDSDFAIWKEDNVFVISDSFDMVDLEDDGFDYCQVQLLSEHMYTKDLGWKIQPLFSFKKEHLEEFRNFMEFEIAYKDGRFCDIPRHIQLNY